jgi:hypothetical protein
METMYFVLGMLSIVALAFVMVIVWGLLKIKKQQDEIKMLKSFNEDSHRLIYSMNEEVNRRISREIDDLNQVISTDRREFGEEARRISMNFDRRFDDVWGNFRDLRNEMVELGKSEIDISKSYTDSRIDKLIDTYFDMVNVKKQIIK